MKPQGVIPGKDDPPKNKNRGAVGRIIGGVSLLPPLCGSNKWYWLPGVTPVGSPPAIIPSHLRCSFYFKSRNGKPVCQIFTASLHQPLGSPSGRNRCQRDRLASEGGSVRPCPLHHAATPLLFIPTFSKHTNRNAIGVTGI